MKLILVMNSLRYFIGLEAYFASILNNVQIESTILTSSYM